MLPLLLMTGLPRSLGSNQVQYSSIRRLLRARSGGPRGRAMASMRPRPPKS